jgi:uncharacterized repeat protein (TIGR01451 family)
VRTHAGRFSAAVAASLLFVALPSSAIAAVSPPTISSQFTPTSIGSGGTTALSFTITNPSATDTLDNVGFTDTLPPGLVVDDPNGQNGTCGSASTLTAVASSSTISLTGGTLLAGANCVVQVSVTSSAPGSYQNSTGPVTSTEAGNGNSDTRTLTVFGLPAVALTAPTENAVYAFGQKVIAHYSCQDAAGAPGIAACSGDADSGTPIDTSTAGPNTFSVSAISADGAISTQTIDYVVLPDSRFTVTRVTGHTDGSVTFKVALPNPGKLVSTVTHNGTTFGQTSTRVGSDGTSSITVKPNAAARRLIAADARAKHPKPILVNLSVSFTPLHGVKRTSSGGSLRFIP